MSRADIHVAVLKGGWSPEREVSLSTGQECAKALRQAGFRVSEIDIDRSIAGTLEALHPDVCFNALHGPVGEDGTIQGMLNVLGIPYTHSGVRASSVAMDKPTAKDVFTRHGLRCPGGMVVHIQEFERGHPMTPPYVIKPIDQGSSVGVHIVRDGDNYRPGGEDWTFGERVLVEPFIDGRELTVAVLDGEALEVTEITSDRGFYDYEAKYAEGGSIHLIPAPIPDPIRQEALDVARRAHEALGCRGVTRCDFRYDDTAADPGTLYLLEINTQPGMTPTSLVPEQAAYRGISFPDLVARMVEGARCDY
ncbi:MAG: D-alanine--D-alanine ligase [Alphaproteobacteria bacterium]|nr:D-alanine--D-alanine ligase [Alphaproteobacteria bacterium]